MLKGINGAQNKCDVEEGLMKGILRVELGKDIIREWCLAQPCKMSRNRTKSPLFRAFTLWGILNPESIEFSIKRAANLIFP